MFDFFLYHHEFFQTQTLLLCGILATSIINIIIYVNALSHQIYFTNSLDYYISEWMESGSDWMEWTGNPTPKSYIPRSRSQTRQPFFLMKETGVLNNFSIFHRREVLRNQISFWKACRKSLWMLITCSDHLIYIYQLFYKNDVNSLQALFMFTE